jgi:pSer/pThr/pTyr-binding forkhead associated (FHA) protein
VVRADRAWFEEVLRRNGPDSAGLQFPAFSTERRFVLDRPQLAIGRRSRSRGIEPEIDLSAPPVDPGVSALHALLVGRPDGGWDVVDLDSTNGTVVGDRPDPIPPNTPVRLADGDVVKVGAWTTITLVAPGRWDQPDQLDQPDQSR